MTLARSVDNSGNWLMSNRFQVIFFDAAGTLFRVRGSVAHIYLRYAINHGFKENAESLQKVQAAFARAFQDAPPAVFATTEPTQIKQCERMWWFDIVHNVFYRVGMFERFDEFFEEVFDVFARPESWMLYPETEKVLEDLKTRQYELGIISNFDSRLFVVLRGLGIADYFQTVTISSLSHAAKPSGRIFMQALAKHAVEPADAVHVGDSLEEDVKGAELAGLTGILVQREPGSQARDVRTVRSLDELPSILLLAD